MGASGEAPHPQPVGMSAALKQNPAKGFREGILWYQRPDRQRQTARRQ